MSIATESLTLKRVRERHTGYFIIVNYPKTYPIDKELIMSQQKGVKTKISYKNKKKYNCKRQRRAGGRGGGGINMKD